MRGRLAAAVLLAGAALSFAPGCQSIYYEAMEVFGEEKRDLLRSELKGFVGDQEEAGRAFTSALDRVKSLTSFDGGNLEREYDRLKDAYDDAESAAEQIDDRIEEIDTVANDLFDEWEDELTLMRSKTLKDTSRRKLRESRNRFRQTQRMMLASRKAMGKVLPVFQDHVLFLKHNLNAAAVGSLGASMIHVEKDIKELQRSIEASIREAQRYIETMP